MKLGLQKTTLGSAYDVRDGTHDSPKYEETGWPLVTSKNLKDSRLDLAGAKYISELDFRSISKRSEVHRGDVLFAMIGTIGNPVVVESTPNFAIKNVALFKVPPSHDSHYLRYYLSTPKVVEKMMADAKGTTQKFVGLGYLRNFPITLPPLDEQRRIVAVLDKAFAGIATATANAQKNLTNARTLFESYLNSAFDQANNEWVEKPISGFAKVFDGPHATPKTVDVGPVFLGISALQDGEINLGQTRHVTAVDYARWTKRVVPRAGDVVFSYETRLGQVAIVPEGLECCLGRRMGLVRLDKNQVNPMFFVYSYLAPPFQNLLKEKTIKGATVDRIPLKDFPSFPMKVPGIDLQIEVVDAVLNMRRKIANLEAGYQSKLASLSELKQSLLQKAFAGELT